MRQNESNDLWMRVVKEIRNIANGSGTVEVKSASGDTVVIGTSDVTISAPAVQEDWTLRVI